MEALIAAGASIIVGVLSLVGVMTTNANSNKKIEHKLETAQAVTDTKLEQLTKHVEAHNQVITRTFSLEQQTCVINEQIKVINHRLADLEQQKG